MRSFEPEQEMPEDELDVRCRAIGGRILDGIDAMLDELTHPSIRHAAIARAAWAAVAPRYCRRTRCRRAQRCQREVCAVPRILKTSSRGA